jgi:hypothetical protein
VIFKVQKPLSSNLGKAPALIYNEGRAVQFYLEIDESLSQLFAEHGIKVFVDGEALRNESGQRALLIRKVVPDPGW